MSSAIISPRFDWVECRDAWKANLHLVSLVASKTISTLGPKGGYKMITYNRGPEQVVKVTKDVVAIVEELGVHYPAIKTIAEAAKIHREEVGDGVATFVILYSQLLQNAEGMLSKGVHPIVIINGYHEAAKKALEVIDHDAVEIGENSLYKVLNTVDCGRDILSAKLSQIVIEACHLVNKNGHIDPNRIKIVKKPGGNTDDSSLIKGVIVRKDKVHPNMANNIEHPKIALTTGQIGLNRLEVKMKGQGTFPINININDPLRMSTFKTEEKMLKLSLVDKIRSSGANVVITSQLIDQDIQNAFAREGIFAVMSVEREVLDVVSEATGANIVGDIADLSEKDLGHAEKLELGQIHLERIVTISGCKGITLLLRVSTTPALDELERIVQSSLFVLRDFMEDGRAVPGGGAIEYHISKVLRAFSLRFQGKEQIVINSFADALEKIPESLAQNNGLNPLDTLIYLNNCHNKSLFSFGVGVDGCYDMTQLSIFDTVRVKKSVIIRAYEVSSLMLGIDTLIQSKDLAKVHTQ